MGWTVALMAASTAFSAVGDLAKGQAESDNLMFQSQVAGYNADLSAAVGEAKSTQFGMKTAAQLGTIKAKQGASGVDVHSKSFTDVRESAREMGMLDALTIRSDAAREAYGYRTRQSMLVKGAEDAKSASYLDAFGSLLSGATSISGHFGKESLVGGGAPSTSGNSLGLDMSSNPATKPYVDPYIQRFSY